ncbi:MAG: YqhV family protein [Thermosediminibacteraceae bacterium]|nr:YqhV family protein [Thermosediminibacteraceae bacterium]
MEKLLLGMALLRFISAAIEFTAAVIFLRLKSLEAALQINALLGLVGPLVFTAVSLLGIFGISGKVSTAKLLIIFTGVLLVLIGTRAR